MVKRIALVCAAVAALGCAAATEPDAGDRASQVVSVGDTVRLRFGETVSIGQNGIRIQFRSVVADSRCPIDALCVWAGDAHVQIGVAQQQYDVHTYPEPQDIEHGAYRIRLVEVGPARRSTDTVRAQDYYIRLEIRAR